MTRAPILVVGAGPVGLVMAAELARHGARVRLVDRLAEPSPLSKAIAIHARTLEAFADMGVAPAILADGNKVHAVNFYGEGRRIGRVSLDPIDSPFPYILNLAQDDTERLLAAHAASFGVTPERGVTLESLAQHPDAVEVTLLHPDGRAETTRFPWVVGCDGAHSTVRKAVGLTFDGAPYEYDWILGDVELEGDLPRDEMHTCLHSAGLLACFPLGGRRVRFIADRPPAPAGQTHPEPTREDFQRILDERGLQGNTVAETHWLSSFRIHHRMVPHHAVGRVFVAGDAAHIHSPAGGQGMNTGIQDAYNLGWKLALAWRGLANETLLDSYHAERHPVAARLLEQTDAMTRAIAIKGTLHRAMRDQAIGMVTQLGFLQSRVVNQLAELEVQYPASPLAQRPQGWLGWLQGGPQGGDRAPDAPLTEAASGHACRLHELLAGPHHTLLLFLGDLDRDARAPWLALGEAVQARLGELGQQVTIATSPAPGGYMDHGRVAHERYGVRPAAAVLVRPDNYVACRSTTPDGRELSAYLDRWQTPAPSVI